MDNRRVNEEYAIVAAELIENEPALIDIKNSNVSIIYLSSEHEKKTKTSIVYGQCEKVQDKNKWAIPADFTITVFEPNCKEFTPEQIKILLFHELLHINIVFKDGAEVYSINDHDLNDFKVIVEKYGVDWSE